MRYLTRFFCFSQEAGRRALKRTGPPVDRFNASDDD
jgi:hypothetical protein